MHAAPQQVGLEPLVSGDAAPRRGTAAVTRGGNWTSAAHLSKVYYADQLSFQSRDLRYAAVSMIGPEHFN